MSDVIRRAECPECGWVSGVESEVGTRCLSLRCDGVLVERVYVAQDADGLAEYKLGRHEGRQEFIDALRDADALRAACEAGHDAYEAESKLRGHVSGSPVAWCDVPEPYYSATVAGYTAGIRAAIDAVTGEQQA